MTKPRHRVKGFPRADSVAVADSVSVVESVAVAELGIGG
jgi:hypothetical protein